MYSPLSLPFTLYLSHSLAPSPLNILSVSHYAITADHITSGIIYTTRRLVCFFKFSELNFVYIFYQTVRFKKSPQIIIRLWSARPRHQADQSVWKSDAIEYFFHFQKAATSLRHIWIVSLNRSDFRVHLTSPLNIWRARTNFFHLFLTLPYGCPRHANRQINIPPSSETRRPYTLSISDALEYSHETVFFLHF